MLNLAPALPNKSLDRNTQELATHFSKTQALQKRLNKLVPFPIPSSNEKLALNQQEADRNYRDYSSRYNTDPILSLFQQRYARVMLRNYGVPEGGNTTAIVYYMGQLINGYSYDFGLITQGMEAIQGKINPAEFNGLLQQALTQVTLRIKMDDMLNERLEKAIYAQENVKGLTNWDYIKYTSNVEIKRKLAIEQAAESLTRLQRLGSI